MAAQCMEPNWWLSEAPLNMPLSEGSLAVSDKLIASTIKTSGVKEGKITRSFEPCELVRKIRR